MSMEKLVYVLAALCAGMSLALFCLMGADKRLAKAGARRVPEKRLGRPIDVDEYFDVNDDFDRP